MLLAATRYARPYRIASNTLLVAAVAATGPEAPMVCFRRVVTSTLRTSFTMTGRLSNPAKS